MSFALSEQLMRKTFSMGENTNNFIHKPAQNMKVFPFSTHSKENEIVLSLSPVVGEWLRIVRNEHTVCDTMENTLKKFVESVDDLEEEEKEKLSTIIRSIYWNGDNGNSLSPKGITSMCYIPCNDQGEVKIAQYLYSVLSNADNLKEIVERAVEQAAKEANVLEQAVLRSLQAADAPCGKTERYYLIHSAPQKLFPRDLQFILEDPLRAKEYLVDLLEFYYFFYTAQTSIVLSSFEHGKRDQIFPLYFSLDWEKTNKARKCYTSGWKTLEKYIGQQFYHAITLEILNQNPTADRYDYIALKEYIDQHGNGQEVASQIGEICRLYQKANAGCKELQNLQPDTNKDPVFTEVDYLYQSVRAVIDNPDGHRYSARDRYLKHFTTFCHRKFLKFRGTSGSMLNITEEFLIFLTKLAIQDEEKLSLNEVFRQFELRGVFLDQPSRDEVIRFYTKLNLIEKKSDSGDAQYVRRIL